MKMLAVAIAAAATLALTVPASAAPYHNQTHAVVYKHGAPHGVTKRKVVRHDRYHWRRAYASTCKITKVRTPTRHGVVIRTIRHCR